MKLFLAILFLSIATVQSQTLTYAQVAKQLRTLIREQQTELEGVQQNLKDSRETADTLLTELKSAKLQIQQVEKEKQGWKDYAGEQHDLWMNAEKRVAEKESAILRRDIIIGLMASAIGAYLFLKFYWHLPI